jgi:hypothetical protein
VARRLSSFRLRPSSSTAITRETPAGWPGTIVLTVKKTVHTSLVSETQPHSMSFSGLPSAVSATRGAAPPAVVLV